MTTVPVVGQRYRDKEDSRRHLLVLEVVPDCPLGRQVRGRIAYGFDDPSDYACDFVIFDHVWGAA